MNKYLTLAIWSFSAAASSFQPSPNQVCLHEGINFNGQRLCFNNKGDLCDTINGGCHGKWNDKIKSIQFGSNVESVKLFKESRYCHKYTTLTSETKNLALSFRDFTSFYLTRKISTHKVCLYVDKHFQGQRLCFNNKGDLCDTINGGCHGKWNDKIKSIQFGSNVESVKLFKESRYCHKYTTLTSETKNLALSFRDFTSFYLTRKISTHKVCLYVDKHFQGQRLCFNNKGDLCDTINGGCHGKWNDKIKSIQFGSNVKSLKLFKDAGYKVVLATLTSETEDLIAGLKDFTSFHVIKKIGKKASLFVQSKRLSR